MKINYLKILRKNMINVLKDVLTNIKNNGLQEGHHLYITFKTNDKKVNTESISFFIYFPSYLFF